MTQAESWEEAEPRPAATLVPLRETTVGLEVLLTIRPEHLRFMGGAAVFPGGAVAPADRDPRWERASTLPPDEAARLLSEDSLEALGAYICALRESFEEVGLLLASGPVDPLPRSDDPERFLEACLDGGVRLATDRLTPAGRWVTPLGAPIRFDTRFFLAEVPDGWEPDPDASEVASCMWVTPDEALARLGRSELLMAPPTVEMLQHLAEYSSIEAARSALAGEPLSGPGRILSARVSPFVHAVLAPNPSPMTGPGTNTYIVGSGECLVIDPAVDDGEYLDTVVANAGRINAIFITHRHLDHVGGVASLVARSECPVRAFGDEPAGGVDVVPVSDGETLTVGGATLTVLHTPGHAPDHCCLLMDGAASLFSGDNILGEGTAVIAPPEGNMRQYLNSLERLRKLQIDRIFPGHFRALDGGKAVIEWYIAHRAERRDQVLRALSKGAATPQEIVQRVYSDTPAHLHAVAEQQVLAMLAMLQEDKKVEWAENRWVKIDVD